MEDPVVKCCGWFRRRDRGKDGLDGFGEREREEVERGVDPTRRFRSRVRLGSCVFTGCESKDDAKDN